MKGTRGKQEHEEEKIRDQKMSKTPSPSPLFTIATCLVIGALEDLGRRIVRQDRSRFAQLTRHLKSESEATQTFLSAHELWPQTDEVIEKAIANSFAHTSYLLKLSGFSSKSDQDVYRFQRVLENYVHDLGVSGVEFSLSELDYRLTSYLSNW